MAIEFGFRSDQDNSRDEIELSFEELDEWISSIAEQEITLESFNEWMLERQYNRSNGILDHNYLERAFPLIKEAIEKGHTRYYKYLGDCYYYGYGSDVSYDDAAKAYLMSFLYHPRNSIADKLKKMDRQNQIKDPNTLAIIQVFRDCENEGRDVALAKAAMRILDGDVYGFPAELAYSILKQAYRKTVNHYSDLCDYTCVISYYLGKFLLNGDWTIKKLVVASELLDEASSDYDSLHCMNWSNEKLESVWGDMLELWGNSEEKVEFYHQKNGINYVEDEDMLYDQWLNSEE